ncbi:MAG: hypothetical protein Kow0026_27930 [Oricola sp.]
MFFQQISTAEGASVAARSNTNILSSTPLNIGTILHTPAVWVALIAIIVIVFAVIRHRGKDEKRGFQDTYHKELEAMRKKRDD